ncbi:chemotaxis protein CheA [Sulfurimicrobium lacus]|uniref:Chemotaxis protein CheA n=1 Tax=Sulfurimicrobium lacus TaxID=2715678 RepID=A0A6F8VHL6_9PROT|nr:chemotaxis protein CheA [Sulfurimicrobium lacus]BCB28661.1 chemotaxis protein CheA [Sulfurimicrobium lacus]
MNMDQALQTFIVESRELLQDMEDGLLRIEGEADQSESVNAIFRAAHTIKGSAGLFGLDDIVAFTHVLESVLDKVRGGKLAVDPDLVALFLLCGDHMATLVNHVERGSEASSADEQLAGSALVEKLARYLEGQPSAAPQQSAVAPPREPTVESSGGGLVDNDNWHISLRFGRDVLRNGMDPLSFFRYLGTLGEIVRITTITDAMPSAAEMDAESCYLGYEINFKSAADKAAIEGVFEFVREDCNIHILPPHSRVDDFVELIRDFPEEDLRLGEILVRCGTLTRNELEMVLEIQSQEDARAEKASGEHQKHLGEIAVEHGMVQQEVVEAALEKQKQVKDTKAKQQQLVRVDAEKLDQLINLIGELVIAGAGVNILAQRSGQPALLESVSTLGRLVEEVRDSALNLRMVQIGETFNRFQRVVRDVSKDLGKDIALIISGAETELDKTVVEKIGDPLTHLVRNSMDHGIENAELRAQRGKPARGTVRLNAYHESGSIVIEVSDDGGGLNRERILAKAIEKGIVAPNHALSEQEVFRLIFEAGFSTAEQVSNISGRGVGMDVVRRNIEALRGNIEIESQYTVGTTIRIRLPLTLAIIDGFLVGVGRSSFVIPLDMVLECVEMSEQDRQALRERNYVNLRNEVLPFIRLRDLFEASGETPRRENIVVVQYAGQKAGLVVDGLLGEFQTVIKPLGSIFQHLKGIGGSTILGSGEVALILDVPSLVQQVVAHEAQPVSRQRANDLALAQ